MSMSKQDFEAIAGAFRMVAMAARGTPNERETAVALVAVAAGIAQYAKTVNPRFDNERFMKASGFALKTGQPVPDTATPNPTIGNFQGYGQVAQWFNEMEDARVEAALKRVVEP